MSICSLSLTIISICSPFNLNFLNISSHNEAYLRNILHIWPLSIRIYPSPYHLLLRPLQFQFLEYFTKHVWEQLSRNIFPAPHSLYLPSAPPYAISPIHTGPRPSIHTPVHTYPYPVAPLPLHTRCSFHLPSIRLRLHPHPRPHRSTSNLASLPLLSTLPFTPGLAPLHLPSRSVHTQSRSPPSSIRTCPHRSTPLPFIFHPRPRPHRSTPISLPSSSIQTSIHTRPRPLALSSIFHPRPSTPLHAQPCSPLPHPILLPSIFHPQVLLPFIFHPHPRLPSSSLQTPVHTRPHPISLPSIFHPHPRPYPSTPNLAPLRFPLRPLHNYISRPHQVLSDLAPPPLLAN